MKAEYGTEKFWQEYQAALSGLSPQPTKVAAGTLAWLVETKLGTQLSIRQRSGLRRQCSAAKEKLLNDPKLQSVEITVLGTGTSLIGKSLKTEIRREEALELALEGFLLTDGLEAPTEPEEMNRTIRETNLPTPERTRLP